MQTMALKEQSEEEGKAEQKGKKPYFHNHVAE